MICTSYHVLAIEINRALKDFGCGGMHLSKDRHNIRAQPPRHATMREGTKHETNPQTKPKASHMLFYSSHRVER